MYIKSAEIENIKSITKFNIEFKKPAGWHVLIGDNGSGKSTIIRSLALTLVGPNEALGLRADWRDWLNMRADKGYIKLNLDYSDIDRRTGSGRKIENYSIPNQLYFTRTNGNVYFSSLVKEINGIEPAQYNWGNGEGWFSVAYGPYRRFAGGNPEWSKVFYSLPKLGAHLSAFGEDVALTEAIDWLVKLNYQLLEQKESANIIHYIKKLVNSPDFLPHKAEIESISSEGVMFKDGNGSLINVNQLSDGYRSILSLTFELIRQLVRVYGEYDVFKDIRQDNMIIDLPGVVLIDEVDAHLHPTWQTRIGQWFTKYFPKIQFIVTTHSPLICRACENGTIWRLAAPGSNNGSNEITDIDRERLINGNVLDAYGTDIFGKNVSISEDSNEKTNRLAELNIKSIMGAISDVEKEELNRLKSIFPTK